MIIEISAYDNFEKEKIPIDEEARTLMEKWQI